MNEFSSIVKDNLGISILITIFLISLILFIRGKIKYQFHLKECQKGNHEFETCTSKWMIKPSHADEITGRDDYDAFSWRYNGFKYKRISTVCKHCGFLKERKWIKLGEYNSISMSSDDMDEYNENGIIKWS